MAFFMDPGAMFLGCLGPSEQKFLVTLIETAAKSGYTRFVEPCAGTFAMANLAVQNGFKPEQIETSDVNMMSTVLGYAITGQSLEPLEIHAQGFSDEELLALCVVELLISGEVGRWVCNNQSVRIVQHLFQMLPHIQWSVAHATEQVLDYLYLPIDTLDVFLSSEA